MPKPQVTTHIPMAIMTLNLLMPRIIDEQAREVLPNLRKKSKTEGDSKGDFHSYLLLSRDNKWPKVVRNQYMANKPNENKLLPETHLKACIKLKKDISEHCNSHQCTLKQQHCSPDCQ